MRKKLFMMLLMGGVLMVAQAQSTKEVKGVVIDKNGNPLPGAKVQATGGAETAVTDADGTFNIEVSRWLKSLTATYPGMRAKKVNLKDNNDVVIKIKNDKHRWFVQGITQYDFGQGTPSIGVMGGMLGNWGWYGKAVVDLATPSDSGYDESRGNGGPAYSFSGGVIKNVYKTLYLYAGAGLGRSYAVSKYEKYTYESPYYSHEYPSCIYNDFEVSLIMDIGLIYQYKKNLNFNLGFSYSSQFEHLFEGERTHDNYGHWTESFGSYYLRIGAGYTF